MEDRPPRKRIVYEKKGSPAIVDPLEFVANKCTTKARRILAHNEEVIAVLWFDKHYHDRLHHGDENGKRDNIEMESVEDLVRDSLSHLIYYSCLVKGFSFLNTDPIVGQPIRVLLQRQEGASMLNVLIQAAYINRSEYEITVITAMCVNDFKLGTGQYAVEIDGDSSYLKKFENKKFIEIASI